MIREGVSLSRRVVWALESLEKKFEPALPEQRLRLVLMMRWELLPNSQFFIPDKWRTMVHYYEVYDDNRKLSRAKNWMCWKAYVRSSRLHLEIMENGKREHIKRCEDVLDLLQRPGVQFEPVPEYPPGVFGLQVWLCEHDNGEVVDPVEKNDRENRP